MEKDPHSETPEMDRVADEVVHGARPLSPPGVWPFLGALLTTTFGLAFLFVNGAPIVLAPSREAQSGVEILSLQLGWIVPCALGLMAAKGVPHTAHIWRRVVDLALVGAIALLATNFDTATPRREFVIATLFLLAACVIVRSVGFAIGILFRQRVKARREAYFAKQRAARDQILRR